MDEAPPPVLQARDLQIHFPLSGGGVLRAVDGVSLQVKAGEVLGLVGESGCGKSTLARGLLGLVPLCAGAVFFKGLELSKAPAPFRKQARLRMQMVFQDPQASLNPRLSIYDTLSEPLRVHRLCAAQELEARLRSLLDRVGLPSSALRKYPHEFSGGQRQRIALARALALEPEVLIADEPVSALDVSIQAQIVNLFDGLVRQLQLALLFISHDLSVVRHLSTRVAVMYLGRVVETGEAERLISAPRHPYTEALVQAVPLPDPVRARARAKPAVLGDPPSPLNPPSGCAFHPRCPVKQEPCSKQVPALRAQADGSCLACPVREKLPARASAEVPASDA